MLVICNWRYMLFPLQFQPLQLSQFPHYHTPIPLLSHTAVPYPCKQKPYCCMLMFLIMWNNTCVLVNKIISPSIRCAMVRSWCAWWHQLIRFLSAMRCAIKREIETGELILYHLVLGNAFSQLISYLHILKVGFCSQHRIGVVYHFFSARNIFVLVECTKMCS
jgi:hypothetical protein